jgi:hypothetical protein
MGYHDAEVVIDIDVDWPLDAACGMVETISPADPRWPKICPCGYVFAEDDERQPNMHRLYRRSDTGALTPLRPLSHDGARRCLVGAMWDAEWMGDEYRGPDGVHLCVMTPAGEWLVDGPASNDTPGNRGWKRTGKPPKVTATPSIGFGASCERYHGWLRDGVLVDA